VTQGTVIVPGLRSSRIHVAKHPRRPRIEMMIERDELVRATGLTRLRTVFVTLAALRPCSVSSRSGDRQSSSGPRGGR